MVRSLRTRAPLSTLLREAAKKFLLLMAGPLRPNPLPPLELNGRRKVGKKSSKKSFFLNGPAFYPPLLMAWPQREELFFDIERRTLFSKNQLVAFNKIQEKRNMNIKTFLFLSKKSFEMYCSYLSKQDKPLSFRRLSVS